jgi:nucleotide-binding universal stress UspA family protein
MIKKMLVPIDGSETSRKALAYAVGLAKQTGSTIVVLSVVEKDPFFVAQTVPPVATPTHLMENMEDYLIQAAQALVEEAGNFCGSSGVDAQKLVRTGHPVREIARAAEDLGADIIVIGSHGRSALQASLLGSVTVGVIHRETKVPVLVVRR